MPAPRASLHRVHMRHPGNTAAIEGPFKARTLGPHQVVAILGRAERDGCADDFTGTHASGPGWRRAGG